jgi:hypothetical protein
MDRRMTPVVVFVYTLAVVLTGLWIANPSWPALNPVQIGMIAVLSVLWTVYFDQALVSRIVDMETHEDEEESGDGTDPEAAHESEQAG